MFGFSFVPLMQEDGRTLPDGTHELIVHKVTSVRGWGSCEKQGRSTNSQSYPHSGKEKKQTAKILFWMIAGRESAFLRVVSLDSIIF